MSPRSSSAAKPPSYAEFSPPDQKTGSLVREDGVRFAAVSVDFVQGFHLAVFEQFAERAQNILYRCGYEWGLQEMLRLNQRLHDELGGKADLWQMDPKYIFDSWWAPLQAAGYGTCRFDLSRLSRGLAVVDLQQSIVADALAGTDQPVCHCYAGLFAGALSFFARGERHATELQCNAVGYESCLFLVGPGPDIDAAELSRQRGTPAADVIRSLG